MTTFRSIIATAIVSYSAGCATLPDASKITDHAPAQAAPKILTSKRMLSREQSRALMERLQKGAKPTDLLQRHNAVLEMVSGHPLTAGNKVTLLIDGRSTYAAMFKAMESARETINVETFKIDDDEISRAFANVFLKKQSQGVQVNFMYDSMGSITTPASFFDRLRQAGINVVAVHPLGAENGENVPTVHADHRKLLVVDGRVAITGGINISRVYASTPFKKKQEKRPSVPWRDTDIQLEGPVVAQFQKEFLEMWANQQGSPLAGRNYFPKLKKEGDDLVRAISSTPGENNRINYISYIAALAFAEHSIHLTNAYFVPDRRTLEALADAAKRGVDVKIVLPSVSDSKVALHAMRYNYEYLLKAGVKLYERQRALLHSKTAVIDGVWSTVGSTNMDPMSLSQNYEINAVIIGREFALEMGKMFAADLSESEQVTLAKWKKRSLSQKTKEFFAHLLSPIM
ncbi:phospholipase D-like domain-containing protein [Geomonas sp. RF6]|uniref:phospholipase D-like domain-containing protein n=1 Tax=Geomonas sp. RF6 TaxID=2897342 RepID=UPI001E31C027|nr:phospholipase D-like domain-containing protein [Geomonas sp. RF6]UFS69539.1 phospholipase D-like domain-containing protein [Geomonas sp. RF6]